MAGSLQVLGMCGSGDAGQTMRIPSILRRFYCEGFYCEAFYRHVESNKEESTRTFFLSSP